MNALEQVVPKSVRNPCLWGLMAAPPCLVFAGEAAGKRREADSCCIFILLLLLEPKGRDG